MLFNTATGRGYLAGRRGVSPALVEALGSFGLSSICNVARRDRGRAPGRPRTATTSIVTVATDGASMYRTERDKVLARDFAGGFDEVAAAEVFGRHVLGGGADGQRCCELTPADRRRIFNLGYFTWVEQQGISFEAFVERREPGFWRDLRAALPAWDELIGSSTSAPGRRCPHDRRPGSRPADAGRRQAGLPITYGCAGCGYEAPDDRPVPLRCPRARPDDDIDHVLTRYLDAARLSYPTGAEANPFVRYRTLFHAYHLALAAGWTDARLRGARRATRRGDRRRRRTRLPGDAVRAAGRAQRAPRVRP